jgi:hypothetical protein
MIRNKRVRRILAGLLIALGLLLMLLAPSAHLGLIAFGVGVALELLGLAIEHRDRR